MVPGKGPSWLNCALGRARGADNARSGRAVLNIGGQRATSVFLPRRLVSRAVAPGLIGAECIHPHNLSNFMVCGKLREARAYPQGRVPQLSVQKNDFSRSFTITTASRLSIHRSLVSFCRCYASSVTVSQPISERLVTPPMFFLPLQQFRRASAIRDPCNASSVGASTNSLTVLLSGFLPILCALIGPNLAIGLSCIPIVGNIRWYSCPHFSCHMSGIGHAQLQ